MNASLPLGLEALKSVLWWLPALIYGGLALSSGLGGRFWPQKWPHLGAGLLGLSMLLGLLILEWMALGAGHVIPHPDAFALDRFSLFFTAMATTIGLLVLPLTTDYFEGDGKKLSTVLLLFYLSLLGLYGLVIGQDLMVIYGAMELMCLASYGLVAQNFADHKSTEGALKYFISGGFASACLCFGIALTYGALGSLDLQVLGPILKGVGDLDGAILRLQNQGALLPELLPVALGLLLVGLLAKMGIAPFHMWVPDAHQGAPAPLSALLSTLMLAGGFAAFMRIFFTAFLELASLWQPIIALLAGLTLVVGHFAALNQWDVKRMLAYSSVAHGGYALMGLLAVDAGAGTENSGRLLFYLMAYAAMNMGAFGVIIYLQKKSELEVTDLDSYGGLGFKYPLLGAAMTTFLLGLGGLPPTAGFVAKFNLLLAVAAKGHWGLVGLALLTQIVSIYYYGRVVFYLYMKSDAGTVRLRPQLLSAGVIGLLVMVVMYMGILPSTFPLRFLQWATDSALRL